jgi:hypothetical protein
MSRKIDRALHGPSWLEVILGALLSFVVGVLLGAGLLIFRPVLVVKEMPKEEARDKNAVYFVEGSRDSSKARQALAKRKDFAEGRSVSVIEDELNALAGPATAFAPARAPKSGEAPKAGDKAGAVAGEDIVATGTPNFRVRDGLMQVGVPVTLSLPGISQKVVVQTRGVFQKEGSVFVYAPGVFYVGSLPVERLPVLAKYAREKFLSGQVIPEDIKASWAKLTNVAIEGNALNLTMP